MYVVEESPCPLMAGPSHLPLKKMPHFLATTHIFYLQMEKKKMCFADFKIHHYLRGHQNVFFSIDVPPRINRDL